MRPQPARSVNLATTSAAGRPQQDNCWLQEPLEHRELTALDFGCNLSRNQCRVRKDHGPQNLAMISHNLLKNENTLKVGIQGKRLNAGWREDYLLKVLLG